MFLIMLPVTEAPSIDAAVVEEVPSYNGQPMPQLAEHPVAIVAPDGTVTVTSAFEAERILAAPPESEEQQNLRLCLDLQEAKPWIDWGCE